MKSDNTIGAKASILDEAKKGVYGEKEKSYGHPKTDFQFTADVMTIVFRRKGYLKEGVSLSAEDTAIFQLSSKLSRQLNAHKRDNLVDLAGYVETWARVLGEDA